MAVDKATPWIMRGAWALLPVTAGVALADAVHGWSTPVRTTASILLWLGWAAVAVATVIAAPLCLAVVRLGTATAMVVGAVAMVATSKPWAGVFALVALAAGARPEVAEWFVNGPAYANERRFPLRTPGALLLGPLWIAAAVVVGAPATGVLLLAAKQWIPGAVVLVLGGAAGFFAARALFGLTRRWVVFVPAGLVLHDPMTLADPVLFERKLIETLRAAPADTDSLDLTQGALGLALELVLTEKVPMVRTTGRGDALSGASARLLFTPTRPGRVLAEADARRVPVG